MQRHCADVNSPYIRKCWTNSGGPLTNSLLWGMNPGLSHSRCSNPWATSHPKIRYTKKGLSSTPLLSLFWRLPRNLEVYFCEFYCVAYHLLYASSLEVFCYTVWRTSYRCITQKLFFNVVFEYACLFCITLSFSLYLLLPPTAYYREKKIVIMCHYLMFSMCNVSSPFTVTLCCGPWVKGVAEMADELECPLKYLCAGLDSLPCPIPSILSQKKIYFEKWCVSKEQAA